MGLTKRQSEIVEKAIEIMVEEGFYRLTVKNLADKMGFSEPALYRHFKDKKDILIAVVETVKANMLSIVNKTDLTLNSEDLFLKLMCEITGYLKKVRGVTILIMSETSIQNDRDLREAMYSFYQSMLKKVSEFLETKKDLGEIREDVDTYVAAQVFLGIIQSMVLKHFLSGRESGIDENCEKIIKIFLKGVLNG